MHGLAMQPYSKIFAQKKITPPHKNISIGRQTYRADITTGTILETGPEGTKKYPIQQVLGGKNVYYFLTSLDGGRLQTLPVAYDVHKKEWFDTALSGVRHFPCGDTSRPFNWKDSAYTFNTACYGCHVSQLATNYDLPSDTYHSTWAEPGINCETCHGPSAAHNAIARTIPKGQPLSDPRIISTRTMTTQERNDLCMSCHAKAGPLTTEYHPKEQFFDHFDLVTLESSDFYPDGRDLGENYTCTTWSLSPCVASGKLDCMHCHTSSGRYRFKKDHFNDACLPCHSEKVNNLVAHTHHPEKSEGSKCISCHMPMTTFARMTRSDHSMIPPTPAITMAYQSPNACNICHQDKDAPWADAYVRQWRTRDYQAPLLQRATLIDAARKRDWSMLPQMLAYIQSTDRNAIFTTSLIRLMNASADERITPVMLAAMEDPSPLVRAATAENLGLRPSLESARALLNATGDASRLVRTRAVAGLAGYPSDRLPKALKATFDQANEDYLAFIMARPDQWTAHYNMGNYQLNHGRAQEAIVSYKEALKREPHAVMAMVNTSIAFARMGETEKSEKALQNALRQAPENAVVNFNMGLLKAEKKEPEQAENYLKKAMDLDPQMADAAYNLCIITAKDRIEEAVVWCQKAVEIRPQEPRYACTAAFFLYKKGEKEKAISILQGVVKKYPDYKDAGMLLKEISTQDNAS